MIAVGIGQGVSQEELRGMASDPIDKNVINVRNFDALDEVLNSLTQGLCNSEYMNL